MNPILGAGLLMSAVLAAAPAYAANESQHAYGKKVCVTVLEVGGVIGAVAFAGVQRLKKYGEAVALLLGEKIAGEFIAEIVCGIILPPSSPDPPSPTVKNPYHTCPSAEYVRIDGECELLLPRAGAQGGSDQLSDSDFLVRWRDSATRRERLRQLQFPGDNPWLR